ncbi:chorismate mutase [Ruminiclostridium papyrosolvens DSM 2782]|uniref:chorismate mutase n=1 Tax=Ruminiclostridium papyrosolvens DSM 2782 TaxID=588581 RepID=F1TA04_9FIRM|nr:chorismate mutase [Ruminiclostridium papyrosolvens]EGD48746.1 chorismate mutase [Ruminiclostridium papyrosolvens DSM 2782]WES32498.1 chorismate mutase [Ruminiclostridium papyrosolvens DSM 2782]
MAVRAVRGAITVSENTKELIWEGTKELLVEIIERNSLEYTDIISVIFTVTQDLNAAFPAVAARQIGWNDIPLMCTSEINVPGSLKKCIRVMIHINTEKTNTDINHVYLKGAQVLRPDLAKQQ